MDVGIDIVEIKRIAKSVRKSGFLNRVFTPQEIKYCRAKKQSSQHYAVRFAAKEAVWKALGRKGIALKEISVKNSPDGKPEIVLAKLKKLEKRVSISLSHSSEYAVAVAIVI